MERFKQLIAKVKTVPLDPVVKAQVRERVMAYMAMKPVRTEQLVRPLDQRSRFSFLFTPLRLKFMPVLLVIMLLVGGGTSFAAEQALPGDVLYPVKIHVNEAVRSSLTFSTEAKANLAARLAERRLEEGEKLAAQGRLDAEAQASVEENFKQHAVRVQERIERLEKKDKPAAADVSLRFEASLKAHEAILVKIEARSETPAAQKGDEKVKLNVGALRKAVHEAAEKSIKIRTEERGREHPLDKGRREGKK